jgi:adenosine deaminase
MVGVQHHLIEDITKYLTLVISETNGLSLNDTLELMVLESEVKKTPHVLKAIIEFQELLGGFQESKVEIHTLLGHPVAKAIFQFFKNFPLPYHEEHIHLTGSLSAEFIYPRLKKLLDSPQGKMIEEKIAEVYGKESLPIKGVDDVNNLIRLGEGDQFMRYLKILYLSKLILINKKAHVEAAYHMAKELYENYNVGNIRLKFTLSRATTMSDEQIPGSENVTEKDVLFGLYEGFMLYKKENPRFNFILSPCFRKESSFYDPSNYKNKKENFDAQVDLILKILEQHPELKDYLTDVDTVGDERDLYRKVHFDEMKTGLRRLQYNGFKVRSHHGETWLTLRKGVQSVDNAMNIWHIETLEHGLSIGINPNFFFQRIFQKVIELNEESQPIPKNTDIYEELMDMMWTDKKVLNKLLKGKKLNAAEKTEFIKVKFHTAREIEHYQHDILNRMIDKQVSLVALPTSNLKLTNSFPDYKDHPFSWWEKKGVNLSVGTDNYITLNTNFIQEMMILLFSDPSDLKITKLLMVTTRETRRPYISHLLWQMRKGVLK